mgnify:FL=1
MAGIPLHFRTDNDKYYTTKQITGRLTLSRTYMIRLMKWGKFPRPIDKADLPFKCNGCIWDRAVVDQWFKDNREYDGKYAPRKKPGQIMVEFTPTEKAFIKEMNSMLGCESTVETFIKEAALFKAKQIHNGIRNDPEPSFYVGRKQTGESFATAARQPRNEKYIQKLEKYEELRQKLEAQVFTGRQSKGGCQA